MSSIQHYEGLCCIRVLMDINILDVGNVTIVDMQGKIMIIYIFIILHFQHLSRLGLFEINVRSIYKHSKAYKTIIY